MIHKRQLEWRRLTITYERRTKNHRMGRFGGGWNFKLGIQASSWRSFILNLGIAMVRFHYETKADAKRRIENTCVRPDCNRYKVFGSSFCRRHTAC